MVSKKSLAYTVVALGVSASAALSGCEFNHADSESSKDPRQNIDPKFTYFLRGTVTEEKHTDNFFNPDAYSASMKTMYGQKMVEVLGCAEARTLDECVKPGDSLEIIFNDMQRKERCVFQIDSYRDTVKVNGEVVSFTTY